MILYGSQTIDKNDIDAVIKVLKSDWLTQGPNIPEFERLLADYCGAKYAVAASSGTAALHLAYLVAGLKPGDEVITTPNTFAATTNMILAVGAKPIFCDIDLRDFNIDADKIESLITKKTKAIVPVHFAGRACVMDKIHKLAEKYHLKVIEDACHALGGEYQGKKIGSLGSDMTVFSFHPVKSITTGEGGAILTNNKDYYDQLISLRSHGIRKNEQGKNVMTQLGYNYRLTDIQACLGGSQLKKLDQFIQKRRELADLYYKKLAKAKQVILPAKTGSEQSAWHLFVIRLASEEARDGLVAHLKNAGIGINYHYPCVFRHPYYQNLGYDREQCPQAVTYEKTALTIPLHPKLKKSDISYICQTIKDFKT